MQNYTSNKIPNMLFFDIETVREFKTFQDFTACRSLENWKRVAAKFYADALKAGETVTDEEIYLTKAALFPEYARVVCVAFGFIEFDQTGAPVKKIYNIKSINEKEILEKFQGQLDKAYQNNANINLVGHNILEYDIPFLMKRMIKYGIKIPIVLKNAIDAKPWEAKVTDTMKDWKMGTSKIMSLDTIAEFLGIPSSKQGTVNGSNLGDYFWNHTDDEITKLNNIATYCRADVSVVMDLVLKLVVV